MLLSIWQLFHLSSWCLSLCCHFVRGSLLQFSLVLWISQSIFKTSIPNVSPLPKHFSSINFFKMSSSQQPSTLILIERAITLSQQLLHWCPLRQLDYEIALHQQLSCSTPLTPDYFLHHGIFWSVSLSLFTLEKLLIASSECRRGCHCKLSTERARLMPVPKMVLSRLGPCVCWQQTHIHLWFCCNTADI